MSDKLSDKFKVGDRVRYKMLAYWDDGCAVTGQGVVCRVDDSWAIWIHNTTHTDPGNECLLASSDELTLIPGTATVQDPPRSGALR